MKLFKQLIFIIIVLFFLTCKNRSTIEKEYYPNGSIKKTIIYTKYKIDREENLFFQNGQISQKCYYKNGKLDSLFISYEPNGQILTKGYFKEGVAIGPTFYYVNGNLKLYNERDLNGGIYYVKKYDTLTNKLIKEEGVCLSPYFVTRIINNSLNSKEILFFYAEPKGYTNTLQVFSNNNPINFNILDAAHLGMVRINKVKDAKIEITIHSTLKDSLRFVCSDSIKISL